DEVDERARHLLVLEPVLEAHHLHREVQAIEMLFQAEEIHILPTLVPISANALENSGAVFDARRQRVDLRVGEGHDLAIHREIFRVFHRGPRGVSETAQFQPRSRDRGKSGGVAYWNAFYAGIAPRATWRKTALERTLPGVAELEWVGVTGSVPALEK